MSVVRIACGSLALGCLVACQSSPRSEEVGYSGFLMDYETLELRGENDPAWIYEREDLNLDDYTRLILDPVEIIYDEDSSLSDLSEEDLQFLGVIFREEVRKRVDKRFILTREPGPRTLRLRLALTDVDLADVDGEMLITYVVPLTVMDAAHEFVYGSSLWMGSVTVEAELLDAETEERLIAAVDRKEGARSSPGALASWDDVRRAFSSWADDVKKRVVDRRGSRQ